MGRIVLKANLPLKAKLESDPKYSIRSVSESDTLDLGRLYFNSYDPGIACSTEEEAIDDIRQSFVGEYGPFDWSSSKVLEEAGKIIGAVLVVKHNSWDKSLTCPYIIELFVDRLHRGKKLGQLLIAGACQGIDKSEIALTVDNSNIRAMVVYKRLGFYEFASN